MVAIYECEAVKRVAALQADTLSVFPGTQRVIDILTRMSEALFAAHQAGDSAVQVQISNWHPELVGKSAEAILGRSFSREDARLTLAREHGFSDWDAVSHAPFDPDFETAVDAVVTGERETLTGVLDRRPELVQKRSPFGHGATLLIYVAANGVETWRQKVPANAPEVASLLIQSGADPDAKARLYGGEHDTLSLLASSAHPQEAGLTQAIARALRTRT